MKVGMNMLAVGGTIHPDTDRKVLELAKTSGFDGVEIPIFGGEPKEYAALGKVLDSIGLERTSVTIIPDVEHSPVNPDAKARAKARDHLHWAIDCTHALGGTMMVGPYYQPLGVFSGNAPTDDELKNAADVLREAADYAQKAKVGLSIEPLNRFECYMLNTMEAASKLRARIAHPNLSYMYDSFHANIEERRPTVEVRKFGKEISHIHISENDRGIPGRGHIPWNDVFDAIKATGYDGWLTVEAFGRGIPALAAATRVWRDLFPDIPTLFKESAAMIRGHLARK